MQNNQVKEQPAAGMAIEDIYFILFRHKWKILVFSVAGLIAAAILFFRSAPQYQSEAKLFVRYVDERKTPNQGDGDGRSQPTASPGEKVIGSELEILSSLDLARQVADGIGPAEFLARAGGGNDRNRAAFLIQKNLFLEVPKNTSVIRIIFKHSDERIVQNVLRQVIDSYFKKHVAIHQAVGVFDEFLTSQTDQLRSRLAQTEEDLRKLKEKAGIFTVDDSRRTFAEQISGLHLEMLKAEAELAERKAALSHLGTIPQAIPEPPKKEPTPPPAEKLDEYKRLADRLDSLWKKEQELLGHFTSSNSLVKTVQSQLAETEKQRRKLEEENPSLATLHAATQHAASSIAGTTLNHAFDSAVDSTRIAALEARMATLTLQLQKLRSEAKTVDDAEAAISQLQRKRSLEETQYTYFSSRLEQGRIDEAVRAIKIVNISEVQAPSPPYRDLKGSYKKIAMTGFGGIGLGLALAFLIELFLDQTIKRPSEVEKHLKLPVFLSIPRISPAGLLRNGSGSPGGNGTAARADESPAADVSAGSPDPGLQVAPWDPHHALHRYSEALRDSLVSYFELNNLTHKPKLVAIAGCAAGGGVTTLAAGLAASLSETGEGNVLLVDMNHANGAAHPFFHGKPGCGLADVFEQEKRGGALIHHNLYLVSDQTSNDKLSRILPKRFTHLVPKMKESDYDYIIFDMPPVDQISITPRVTGLMDIVLFVVEAEKDGREAARRGLTMLRQSRANVGIVLNKTHNYLPRQLRSVL